MNSKNEWFESERATEEAGSSTAAKEKADFTVNDEKVTEEQAAEETDADDFFLLQMYRHR